ncbi:MAG: ATP-binding protein [Patescibacteria group bacterium]|nr:ATP-binding protein [Patescibacteria group bacterium]
MMIERQIFKKVKKAITGRDKQIIIIYGPRQAGKTTLIKSLLSEIKKPATFFTGDDLYAQEILGRNELESLKRIFSKEKIAVIDEAQKIENIGLTLKLLHDNLDIRLITSGSASFDLADKLSEPLTGRTKTFWLYPLSYQEVKEKYKKVSNDLAIEEILRFGLYPKAQTIKNYKDKEDYLYEYINKYLYKDILEFSGIKKPKKVVDLLTLLALQIGSEVSVAELSKNLALSQKAVENYLDILEKMFVIINLRGFSRNLRKEIYKTSKYYFMDLGVRNALLRNFNRLNLRADTGSLFENFFIMEKIKQAENSGKRANFYFWRTYDQKEIDLIEEREGKLVGYECKWSPIKRVSVPRDWQRAYPDAKFEIVNRDNFFKFVS